MGTGPHALVCAYLGQRETSSGIPQVPSMVWGLILLCSVLILGVKMTGLGLGKHARMASQQIPGVAYLCLPSTGITNVSHHPPVSSHFFSFCCCSSCCLKMTI